MIPADPVSSTVVLVSTMAARYWFGTDNPAIPTVSFPMGPAACVAVRESPYSSCTLWFARWNVDWEYRGTVAALHWSVVQPSEMTQRSAEPVSGHKELSQPSTRNLYSATHPVPAESARHQPGPARCRFCQGGDVLCLGRHLEQEHHSHVHVVTDANATRAAIPPENSFVIVHLLPDDREVYPARKRRRDVERDDWCREEADDQQLRPHGEQNRV